MSEKFTKYKDTEQHAEKAGRVALHYILKPKNHEPNVRLVRDFFFYDYVAATPVLRGVEVFGISAMFRENYESLFGDGSDLSAGQRARRKEIEEYMDYAIERELQYYPDVAEEFKFLIESAQRL